MAVVVGRVQDGLAAVGVVERRDVDAEHRVAQEAGLRVVGLVLLDRVLQQRRAGLGLDAGAAEVEVGGAGQQALVDVGGVDLLLDLDAVDRLLAQRVGGARPSWGS